MHDEVMEAIAKDRGVKKATKALESAKADADAIREKIEAGEAKLAELEQEDRRIVREGDTKADPVALHEEIEAVRSEVEAERIRLRPQESAVESLEGQLANARKQAAEKLIGKAQERGDSALQKYLEGVALILDSTAEMAQSEGEYAVLRGVWMKAHERIGGRPVGSPGIFVIDRRGREATEAFCDGMRAAIQDRAAPRVRVARH